VRIPFSIPPIGSRRFDIVGFGLNSVDLIAVVAEYPVSNSKQRLQRFARLAGGPIATAMAACVRLGLRASYIGNFADDDMGAFSRASLEAAGVDIGASWTVKGAINQFSLILVDARSGERTVMWDRHPALTIDPDDVPVSAVAAGRMLLADCQETAASARAARLAHDAGIPTVVDVEKVRPGIADLLQHIDVIIAAEEFPTALTGHEGLGHALQTIGRDFNAPLVAVTLGLQGSLAWCNGREIRTPGFSVDCVDSTGAGDVFRGGFVSACLRHPDGDLEDALAFANAAAALNCRALGARGALPSVEQVDALLLARPQV
jgi:sulfofructose kinase